MFDGMIYGCFIQVKNKHNNCTLFQSAQAFENGNERPFYIKIRKAM